MSESTFVPKKLTLQENAAYKGLAGEIVSIPGTGIAEHDGFTIGGKILQERLDNTFGGRDNLVRNSNFFSIQNGDEFLGNSGPATYTLDGWYVLHNGGSTSNVAQNTIYDNTIDSSTHLALTTMTGGLDSSYSILAQTYNYPSRFAGKKLTLSYWIKCNVSTSITTEFLLSFADGGTVNRGTLIGRESLEAGVWKNVKSTFDMPDIFASDVIDNATDNGRLLFWLDAGDDWNSRTGGILPFSGSFEIANVKIEESPEATSYVVNDYAYEISRVQEYFEVSNRLQLFGSAGTTSHVATCSLNASFNNSKWTDLPVISYTTAFLSGDSLLGRDQEGFSLLANATDAVSGARITSFTANAEIAP